MNIAARYYQSSRRWQKIIFWGVFCPFLAQTLKIAAIIIYLAVQ